MLSHSERRCAKFLEETVFGNELIQSMELFFENTNINIKH